MRKKVLLMVSLLGLIICITGISPGALHAKTITLKIASYDAEQHYLIQKVMLPWCDEIMKRTNGQVKFQWYHSGSLIKAHQAYDAVKKGIVDVVHSSALFTKESSFPVSKVLALPFMFDSSEQADMVYEEAFRTIPELRKEYDDVKMLGFHMVDTMNLSVIKSAPKTLEDMKGLKLWAGSKTAVEMVKALGATPRTVKLEDLYVSLQRKFVDGVLFPTGPIVHFKLTEVLGAHTILKAGTSMMPPMMNLKTWNSLPKDVQNVFDELTPEFTSFCGAIVDDRRALIFSQLRKRGDEVYDLPVEERAKWIGKMEPIYNAWIDEVSKMGIDGKTVLEKVRTLAEKYKDAKVEKEAAWWPSDWKKM